MTDRWTRVVPRALLAHVISPAPNQATRATCTTTAPADTADCRPHGTEGPRCRHAPVNQATSAAHPGGGPDHVRQRKAGPGLLRARRDQQARHRPGHQDQPPRRSGQSASPVTKSQAPTTTKASVITHRSAASLRGQLVDCLGNGVKRVRLQPGGSRPPADHHHRGRGSRNHAHHGTTRRRRSAPADVTRFRVSVRGN